MQGIPPLPLRPPAVQPAIGVAKRSSRRPRRSRPGTMEENMRVISQAELLRLGRGELLALQNKIVCELPVLPEGSHELRVAHVNLQSIRIALARPLFRPR